MNKEAELMLEILEDCLMLRKKRQLTGFGEGVLYLSCVYIAQECRDESKIAIVKDQMRGLRHKK